MPVIIAHCCIVLYSIVVLYLLYNYLSIFRRHRNQKEPNSLWIVSEESQVSSDGQNIEFKLKNTLTGITLKAIIYSLINGQVFRLTVNEINSNRQRFEAKDALLPNIPLDSGLVLSHKTADNGFEAKLGENNNNRVVVNGNPFRIDVYSNDKLVISGNQRSLFKFEHYRQKPTGI